MPTTITTHSKAVGRGTVSVDLGVDDVVRAVNAAVKAGEAFVVLTNTGKVPIGIRVDSIHGIFESEQTVPSLDVTIGRAGIGAAMMQMNRIQVD